MNKKHFNVVVIGGGGTGAAIIHDLQLQGLSSCLVERGELTSGTTGRHHGQLHCGARYAVKDRSIAQECMKETQILRSIAPMALESNNGLFIALNETDEEYAPQFIESCTEAGIMVQEIPVKEALQIEPNLNPHIRRAIMVPDGTIDAWRLPMHFFATAKHNGAIIRPFTPVTGFIFGASKNITGVTVYDLKNRKEDILHSDIVIIAGGAWSGLIAKMADLDIPVTPGPGTLIAVKKRLINMVISRLHPPGDGDIIVPQRGLSIIGTTQYTTNDPDNISVPAEDITFMYKSADEMVPSFSKQKEQAAWIAPRPLAGKSDTNDIAGARLLSRDFAVSDLAQTHNLEGLITVIGGKATVLRVMAEKTVDLVCTKLNVKRHCQTHNTLLLSHRNYFN